MINVTDSFWQAFARQTSGLYREPEYWYLEGVELEHRGYKVVLEHYNLYASSNDYYAVMTRGYRAVRFAEQLSF